MDTKQAKRVEIIIEAPVESRLTDALVEVGVTGFTVLPVLGGSGRSGRRRPARRDQGQHDPRRPNGGDRVPAVGRV